jgi:RNA polymerase sigma-70 factor (ECF subfamily)
MMISRIDAMDVERHRQRLFGLAYRMLGDAHEAEDLVQEAYLRWYQEDRAAVDSPEGWLVRVTSRLAIDRLRRARTERLAYTGPWLPEPIADAADGPAELASDLSVALLVLLERLAPEERAAFLLRDVFDAPYGEIARTLDRTPAAARQMVHRARERVRGGQARFDVPGDVQERLLHRFLDALHADDQQALLALFAPDATFTSDGGGKAHATRNVVRGADRIARLFLGLERKAPDGLTREIVRVNGTPALLTRIHGEPYAVFSFATDGERLLAVYTTLNPDKLRRVGGR